MKFHDELNPKLWDKTDKYELKTEVKQKLNDIALAFKEYLSIPEEAILDIRITGSSANFNYTEHSDLDLHLIVDYDKLHDDCPLVEGYLFSHKSMFNKEHDISIYGVPVEVYAEDCTQEAISNGVYSLETGWIKEPQPIPPTDNDGAVLAKFNELKEAIYKTDDSEEAAELLDKIYTMRKAGLSEVGELSTENLAFKMLRNDGALDKLRNIKKQNIDKQLSLESYQNSNIKKFNDTCNKLLVEEKMSNTHRRLSNIEMTIKNELDKLSFDIVSVTKDTNIPQIEYEICDRVTKDTIYLKAPNLKEILIKVKDLKSSTLGLEEDVDTFCDKIDQADTDIRDLIKQLQGAQDTIQEGVMDKLKSGFNKILGKDEPKETTQDNSSTKTPTENTQEPETTEELFNPVDVIYEFCENLPGHTQTKGRHKTSGDFIYYNGLFKITTYETRQNMTMTVYASATGHFLKDTERVYDHTFSYEPVIDKGIETFKGVIEAQLQKCYDTCKKVLHDFRLDTRKVKLKGLNGELAEIVTKDHKVISCKVYKDSKLTYTMQDVIEDGVMLQEQITVEEKGEPVAYRFYDYMIGHLSLNDIPFNKHSVTDNSRYMGWVKYYTCPDSIEEKCLQQFANKEAPLSALDHKRDALGATFLSDYGYKSKGFEENLYLLQSTLSDLSDVKQKLIEAIGDGNDLNDKWIVREFTDCMHGDGCEDVDYTKIGLIDFLNSCAEEQGTGDIIPYDVSDEELKEYTHMYIPDCEIVQVEHVK